MEAIEDIEPTPAIITEGSLEYFFNNLKLDIQFEDPNFHYEITDIFTHFKHEYPTTDNDIIEELKESYEYETSKQMKPEVYETLMKQDNTITTIYSILEPKYNVKRNKAVHLNDMFGTVYTGAKQSYIDIDRLQQWVDMFHSYEFESNTDKLLCGFILHLLYVRIHPHFDGKW